ncbi:MAG: hypothetical protein AUK28_05210 [Desulfobacterales bacterium CG2_30_60_27]|nr:MAG: hypothetical protein AUK28_05210 [Desulfobacterales bacterium CG2_30_60_27]
MATNRLVAMDAGIIMQVARFGHAHGRVEEDMALDVLGGLQNYLALQAVHGFAGLKGDHPPPTHFFKQGAQFHGRVPQIFEVIVGRGLQARDGAADIAGMHVLQEIADPRVLLGRGAVNLFRLADFVRFPDFFHGKHGGHEALAVSQGDFLARLELGGEIFRNVQDDGDGP